MGHVNFNDHALIKRWWAGKKVNVMSEKFKDKKKRDNHQKQFAFVVGSCAHFQSFGIHSNMNVDSVIEKLQIIIKEKEA